MAQEPLRLELITKRVHVWEKNRQSVRRATRHKWSQLPGADRRARPFRPRVQDVHSSYTDELLPRHAHRSLPCLRAPSSPLRPLSACDLHVLPLSQPTPFSLALALCRTMLLSSYLGQPMPRPRTRRQSRARAQTSTDAEVHPSTTCAHPRIPPCCPSPSPSRPDRAVCSCKEGFHPSLPNIAIVKLEITRA